MERAKGDEGFPETLLKCEQTAALTGKEGDKGRDGDRPKGKFEGKFGGGRDKGGRDKGGRDRDKGGGRDSGPSHRQWATSAAPRERDRPADPNSPFAKLAALKEQLAANRKDS